MLTRRQLRQFVAIVEAGGFTAAAQRLNLSQPTLSAAIAQLEREIGMPVFLRERRHLRLTTAGNELLSRARAIEREFRQAEAGLRSPTPADLPPLRLGVLPSLPAVLVARITAAFTRPQRSTILTEGNDAKLRRDLGNGGIDFAITLLRDDERNGAVLDERYGLMVGQTHPLAGRTRVEAQELANETMIARRSCEILAETSQFFTQRGVRPRFVLRSTNDERCMAMVVAGLGLTTAPLCYANSGIRALAIEGYGFRRHVGVLPPAGETVPSELADAFAQIVSSQRSLTQT